jgi:predicted HicB family RNase H-like nuclease
MTDKQVRIESKLHREISIEAAKRGISIKSLVQTAVENYLQEEQMENELIKLSGDIEQMQEQAWDGNVGQSVDDFMLDYESIEESVDDYLAQYEDMFQEPVPVYYGKLTRSRYSLRELLVGYLERMTE